MFLFFLIYLFILIFNSILLVRILLLHFYFSFEIIGMHSGLFRNPANEYPSDASGSFSKPRTHGTAREPMEHINYYYGYGCNAHSHWLQICPLLINSTRFHSPWTSTVGLGWSQLLVCLIGTARQFSSFYQGMYSEYVCILWSLPLRIDLENPEKQNKTKQKIDPCASD